MAKQRRQHDEEALKNAKALCRLNTRQVDMARALGMNPRKLPRLRPGPQERWKLPAGAFIEECYRKRFGEHPQKREPADARPHTRPGISDAHGARSVQDAMSQVGELVCYLMNLADDLQQWLAHGKITDVLPEVSKELRDVAKALDTGAWISAIPGIPLPPRPARAAPPRERVHTPSQDDGDDIPF
jgi:hypothetical protein